jgi:hypothetical protein
LADQKISELGELSAPAANDQVEILDISDTSGAGSGTNKRIDFSLAANIIVRKSADETLANSTVVQDDDHLFFPVLADEVWFVEAFVIFSAVTAGTNMDFKVGWSVPSGTTMLWGAQGVPSNTLSSWGPTATNTSPTSARTEGQNLAVGGANGTNLGTYQGVVTAGATPGDVHFQWAQNSSNANDLTVESGSFLRLTRLA